MSFYTCFDWFKKLRLFSYVLNLNIDVVLKALYAIVIRWFSLNEAPLGLFRFIYDYLPYFEKINIFFNIIIKKFELIYKDWSKLFVRFIRNNLHNMFYAVSRIHLIMFLLRIDRNFCSVHEEITPIRLYTPANPSSGLRKGVYNLIEVISNEPNK
jgi:hypothetical protein